MGNYLLICIGFHSAVHGNSTGNYLSIFTYLALFRQEFLRLQAFLLSQLLHRL